MPYNLEKSSLLLLPSRDSNSAVIAGNLSGTALGTPLKLVTSVIQQVPVVLATQFLIELSPTIVYNFG